MSVRGLGRSLFEALRRVAGRPVVDREAVRELCNDLVRALLQADVDVKLTVELARRVERRALSEDVPPGLTRREHVVKVVYEEMVKLLGGGRPGVPRVKPGRVNVIMLVGIQGSGKTTTAAKLARFYGRRGFRVGLICADTYRPGAYHQLKQLAEEASAFFYGDPGGRDPVRIVEDGLRFMGGRGVEVVVVDTAGRHRDEESLMEEARILYEKVKPDYVGLVVDGTIGQQARVQAEAFRKVCDVGFIVVSKLDGSAKGGGALSAVAATGAPIAFIGVGEKIGDLEEFDPARFVGRLLGLGDLRGLLEKAREAEVEVSKRRVSAILSGRFTLRDFYEQLEASRRLGPLGKILSLIPGFGYQVSDEEVEKLEARFDRWTAILRSMTREELENPRILNASRIRRIARGAGVGEGDVRELLKRYEEARRALKALRGRRFRVGRLGFPRFS